MTPFTINWRLYPLHLLKPFKKLGVTVLICKRNFVFSNSFRGYTSKKVLSPPSSQPSKNYTLTTSYTHSGTSETPRLKPHVLWLWSRSSKTRSPGWISHLVTHHALAPSLCFSCHPSLWGSAECRSEREGVDPDHCAHTIPQTHQGVKTHFLINWWVFEEKTKKVLK